MHMVCALLCFVGVIHWLIFPYPSGLLHWHCGNLTIAPVPAKRPWWIWINTSCEFIMNDCITTTKQSTTKLYEYFLGYTVALITFIALSMHGPAQQWHKFNSRPDWYHFKTNKSRFKIVFWNKLQLGITRPFEVTKWSWRPNSNTSLQI